MSKNCRGGIDEREFESCGRLQESRQVEAGKMLILKLHPEVDRLFQRAFLGKQTDSTETWFMKMPLGHPVVTDMLPHICPDGHHSTRYTNLCARTTSLTLLQSLVLTTGSCAV